MLLSGEGSREALAEAHEQLVRLAYLLELPAVHTVARERTLRAIVAEVRSAHVVIVRRWPAIETASNAVEQHAAGATNAANLLDDAWSSEAAEPCDGSTSSR